ncbi:MAG TPA: tetratricopeptide repeat protein [Drouetiella sp.]|jgi:tetratricopeptide (TPR) repeat protein
MPNALLNFLTSLVIVSGPATGLSEPFIDTDGDQLRGTPEEKLEYMYNHCKTSEDVRRLARGFQQLANTYDADKKTLNAELAYLLAIRFLESAFPSCDPDIGVAYEQLAGHYAALGEHAMARKANYKAVSILRRNSSDYAVELAVALHNEAWLDMQEHRLNRAEASLNESMKLAKEKLGKTHLLVGMLANSLGDLYIQRNDFIRAEPFLKEALEILRKNPGNLKLQQVIKENYISVLKVNHKYSAAKQVQENLR